MKRIHTFDVEIDSQWSSDEERFVYTAHVVIAGVSVFSLDVSKQMATSYPGREEQAEFDVLHEFARKLKSVLA